MTGPRCLPEHLREREKGKKGRTAPATIGQLRLHAGVHGMASRNRCKSPSLATTTASASAHVPYYTKNHFVALLGSFTPVWIYFLYSISSFTKKKKVCYVLLSSQMRCTKGRSRPHFRAWDRIRSDRGTGPLFPTSGSFFGPRGVTLETTNQKRGEAARCVTARAHLAQQRMTNDSNKQINYASNEMNMNIMAHNE